MRRRHLLTLAPLALVAACTRGSAPSPTETSSGASVKPTEFSLRPTGHGETTAYGPDDRVVAVLTEGARTVRFIGPERTFSENGAKGAIRVRSKVWVRLAPKPWRAQEESERWFRGYLSRYADSTRDDILAVAMQYVRGAPDVRDEDGTAYAGDAGFGLDRDDGVDGADFNDYLGIPWTFPGDGLRQPDDRWYRKLDCSGYLRLVYGYRSGMTLLWTPDGAKGLPRTANGMATGTVGVLVVAGTSPANAPDSLDLVRPGDLVFFALRSDTHISHSGLYLGQDEQGRMRFLSSRPGPDGPTMDDSRNGGPLDAGIFRERLRRVIRL